MYKIDYPHVVINTNVDATNGLYFNADSRSISLNGLEYKTRL